MKKVMGLICLVLLTYGFTSCISIKSNVTPDVVAEYAAATENMTPENSVVIIGMFPGVISGDVVQEKPDSNGEVHKIREEVFVSKPVKPGTQYGIRNLAWSDSARGTFTLTPNAIVDTVNHGSIEDVNCIDIKVPDKPGLYFMGSYATWDLAAAVSNNEMVEYKDSAYWLESGDASYKGILAKLYTAILPYYAGTVWEPYIRSEVENLQK